MESLILQTRKQLLPATGNVLDRFTKQKGRLTPVVQQQI